MTQKEGRLNRRESLNKRLEQKYDCMMINGILCFILENGCVCRIDSMGGEYNALVLEYAENLDKAKENVFDEDGDLFYMEKMSEDEMLNAMINEIENA